MPVRKSSRSTQEPALLSKRQQQLADISDIITKLKDRLNEARQMQKKFFLLSSVSEGLYDEIDKLTKKAPAEPVTDMVLEQINDVIRDIKELAKEDIYVQKQKEFIAAGDNPEQRDVIVVLKQLRQGLDRFESTIDPRIKTILEKIDQAETILVALELFLDGNEAVAKNDIENRGFIASNIWLTHQYPENRFNWERLDGIEFKEYFSEAF